MATRAGARTRAEAGGKCSPEVNIYAGEGSGVLQANTAQGRLNTGYAVVKQVSELTKQWNELICFKNTVEKFQTRAQGDLKGEELVAANASSKAWLGEINDVLSRMSEREGQLHQSMNKFFIPRLTEEDKELKLFLERTLSAWQPLKNQQKSTYSLGVAYVLVKEIEIRTTNPLVERVKKEEGEEETQVVGLETPLSHEEYMQVTKLEHSLLLREAMKAGGLGKERIAALVNLNEERRQIAETKEQVAKKLLEEQGSEAKKLQEEAAQLRQEIKASNERAEQWLMARKKESIGLLGLLPRNPELVEAEVFESQKLSVELAQQLGPEFETKFAMDTKREMGKRLFNKETSDQIVGIDATKSFDEALKQVEVMKKRNAELTTKARALLEKSQGLRAQHGAEADQLEEQARVVTLSVKEGDAKVRQMLLDFQRQIEKQLSSLPKEEVKLLVPKSEAKKKKRKNGEPN